MTDLYPLPPGLVAVTGDERTGKTRLLRRLSGDLPPASDDAPVQDALWLDPGLPQHHADTPEQVWETLKLRCPRWHDECQLGLIDALQMQAHLGKTLSMLSTGTRRKVALIGLLSSGVTVTCLDQPYAALDGASVQVLREFLIDMADHPHRTWVVADYEADARLPWRRVISLD